MARINLLPWREEARRERQRQFLYSLMGTLVLGAILVLTVTMVFLIMPVAAHAPSDISISYNPDMHKLSVTVTHPVDDPKTHFIRGVHVKLNGNVISDPDYKSQPDKNTFTLTYDVNAAAGDEVWVTATCVRGGVLEKSYKVPQPARVATTAQVESTYQTPLPSTAPPTTKAAAGLLSLLGAGAGILLVRRT